MLEYVLTAILVVSLISTALLYKAVAYLRDLLSLMTKWAQQAPVDTDLQQGKFDYIIERAQKDLKANPLHAKARWNLGRAFYGKALWVDAKREMEIVEKQQPTWRRECTQPYLEEIERRLQEQTEEAT